MLVVVQAVCGRNSHNQFHSRYLTAEHSRALHMLKNQTTPPIITTNNMK